MRLVQLPEVDAEVEAAFEYYEREQPGLGREFLDELRRGYEAVLAHPVRWPVGIRGTRRYRLHRFPYSIVYLSEADAVHVIAVMHLHRRPTYWRSRLGIK